MKTPGTVDQTIPDVRDFLAENPAATAPGAGPWTSAEMYEPFSKWLSATGRPARTQRAMSSALIELGWTFRRNSAGRRVYSPPATLAGNAGTPVVFTDVDESPASTPGQDSAPAVGGQSTPDRPARPDAPTGADVVRATLDEYGDQLNGARFSHIVNGCRGSDIAPSDWGEITFSTVEGVLLDEGWFVGAHQETVPDVEKRWYRPAPGNSGPTLPAEPARPLPSWVDVAVTLKDPGKIENRDHARIVYAFLNDDETGPAFPAGGMSVATFHQSMTAWFGPGAAEVSDDDILDVVDGADWTHDFPDGVDWITPPVDWFEGWE